MVDRIFEGFEDLSGTFTVADIVASMVLSFVLCALVGLTYKVTHRAISYSQTYVQTLVMMGMVVSLIMLVVGSNLARAFALVGALSVVRFRNAIKERATSASSSSRWRSAWRRAPASTRSPRSPRS